MPPKRGHPKPRASSRDSLLLGSLHAPEHGDSGSKVTLPPQPAAAQPAAAQQPAVAQHSTVSIGADTVVLVDAENPGTTASDVRANNIVNGTSKRNRGGSRPTQPKPKHPKLKNVGDEYVPFVEMVQYMEGMSWICFRSFVQSARYELEVLRPDRFRRGILRLQPCLRVVSSYDAPRELVHALTDELFPGADTSPTFNLTKPNGSCGYELLHVFGAMEKIQSSDPPLYVNDPVSSVYGLDALLNSIGLVDSIAEFDAFFTQVPTFIEGILDVTHPMFNDAATQLKLTSEQASALHTQLDNFLLLASFEHGDVHHSNILHTLRPDFALCLPYFPHSLRLSFLLVQSPNVLRP
jgi:hypothetical protein